MAKKRYPMIEPVGDGWRATVRIEGKLRKGKKRESQKAAHADAEALKDLREAGQGEGLSTTLGQAIKRVESLCEVQKRRQGTLDWYQKQFGILKKEFGEETKLGSIDKKSVQEFISRRAKECGPRTLRHHLQALRRLFRVSDLLPPTNNLVLPDLVQVKADDFEWDDALSILDKVKKSGKQFEWAALALFLYTGIRRSEAARVRIVNDREDVDFSQKILHIKFGKRRPRSLPCPDGLMKVLDVLNDSTHHEGEWMFPGKTEEHRVMFIHRVFARWREKLDEKRLHAHAFRHTFGSELVRRGVDIPTVAALMGHALGADAITHRYVHVHGPALRKAMESLWV